jgi:hypothetical protein
VAAEGLVRGQTAEFAVRRMLEIGAAVLSHGTNRATVDSVSAEVDRLISALTTMTADQIPSVMNAYAADLDKRLSGIFDGQADTSIQRDIAKVVQEVLITQSKDIVRSLASAESPLEALKAEFSAKLAMLSSRQDEMISRVTAVGERVLASREIQIEKDRGTAKGVEYEQDVEDALEWIFRPFGDAVSFVGSETGVRGTKKGDFIVDVNNDVREETGLRIVVEAKATNLTKPAAMRELDDAMANRDAVAGVLVLSCVDNAPTSGRALRLLTGGRIIVVHDPKESGRLALEAACHIARAFALRTEKEIVGEVDLAAIEDGLMQLDRVIDDAKTIQRGVLAARKGIGQIETGYQGLRERLLEILTEIRQHVTAGRQDAA